MIVNLSLVDNSSLILQRSFFVVLVPVNSKPFFVTGVVSIASRSSLIFFSTTFNATVNDVFYSVNSPTSIEDQSSWSVTSCMFSATSGMPFHFFLSNLSVSNSSSWIFERCVFSSSSGSKAFNFVSSPVSIADKSKLTFASCDFTSLQSNAFYVLTSEIDISDQSTWSFISCTFTSGITIALFFYGSSTSVARSSSFALLSCDLKGAGSALSMVSSSFLVDSESLIHWSHCKMTGYLSSLSVGTTSSVTISNQSSWLIERSSFAAGSGLKDYGVMMFSSGSSLAVDGISNWTISACSSIGSGSSSPALLFSSFFATFSNGSSWFIVDCVVTSAAGAVLLKSARFSVTQSSQVKLVRNMLTGKPGSAISVAASSKILVSGLSAWTMVNGSLLGGQQSAVISSRDSNIVIEGTSAMVVQGVTISASGGPAVVLGSGVTVRASSLLMVRSNFLQSSSQDHCFDIGLLTIVDWGMFRFLDNACTGSSSAIFLVGSVDVTASPPSPFPLLVSRCNILNGAVEAPKFWKDFGIAQGASSLACGQCDAAVDCFWPLTVPTEFTKLDCMYDGAAQCECIDECGADEQLCLPGPQTQMRLKSGGCSLNEFHGARPAPTHSASDNWTLSQDVTRSTTQPELGQADARPLSGALRTTVVAVVSVAVVMYGSTGAMMMQRIQAQQLLNSCVGAADASVDFSSSPTQMHFGSGGDGAAYVRGTVVGNLLLWAACCALSAVVSKILQLRGATSSMSESGTVLALPGRLYLPYSMLLAPTVTASTTLVAGGGTQGSDVAVGVIGIFACSCCLIGVATSSSLAATTMAMSQAATATATTVTMTIRQR